MAVPIAIRNFYDSFIAPLVESAGQRPKSDGMKDSKVQKLQNIRSDYFSYLIMEKEKNLYEYLKTRYADKLQFYETVKVNSNF